MDNIARPAMNNRIISKQKYMSRVDRCPTCKNQERG
jgi:hypothetical protein